MLTPGAVNTCPAVKEIPMPRMIPVATSTFGIVKLCGKFFTTKNIARSKKKPKGIKYKINPKIPKE